MKCTKVSSKNIILIFTGIFALCCYLPLLLVGHAGGVDPREGANYNWPSWEKLDLVERVNYTTGILASLLLYELITENITWKLSRNITLPRTVMVISYFLTCWVFYAFNSSTHQYEYSICSLFVRATIIVGTLFYQLQDNFENNGKCFPTFTILCLQISFVASVWIRMVENFDRTLQYVFIFLSSFSNGCVFLCCLYSFYHIFNTENSSSLFNFRKMLTDEERSTRLTSSTFILLHLFGHLGISIYCGDTDFDHTTPLEISLRNIVDIAILVLVFQVPKHIVYNQKVILEANLATKKSFVRYVSHEIRTPLNTVSLGLEVLHKRLHSQPKFASPLPSPSHSFRSNATSSERDIIEMSQEIYDSCQIALDIVNDLLFYDKIEDKKLILYKQKLNGCEFTEKIIRAFSIQAIHKQIVMQYRHEDSPLLDENISHPTIMLLADESKFSQVIRNLVSNALKFTPQGGSVTITSKFLHSRTRKPSHDSSTPTFLESFLSWFRVLAHFFIDVARYYFVTGFRLTSTSSVSPSIDENYDLEMGPASDIIKGFFRVEVTDTGPGISKENQAKLFKSVIQFDTANLQGGRGSGLGLWISHAIMEHHRGIIGVESTGIPGEGSTFYIEIPAVLFGIMSDVDHQENRMSSNSQIPHSLYDPDDSTVYQFQPVMSSDVDDTNLDFYKIQNTPQPSSTKELFDDVTEFHQSTPLVKLYKRALVVDDSKLNRKMLIAVIDNFFEAIDQAENGEIAVKLVRESWTTNNPYYDMIFMDNLMPVMCGGPATQIIRQMGYTNPVIGVTGNIMENDIQDFLNMGASIVVGKPVSMETLEKLMIEMKPFPSPSKE